MPNFYTWVILNQSEVVGEKQLSVFGSIGGQNSPLMHVFVHNFKFGSQLFDYAFQTVELKLQHFVFWTQITFSFNPHPTEPGFNFL